MQKISIKQEFDCPLPVLLRARMDRYQHLDKFPELKNVQIKEETREGHILKQTREISIADSLPMVIMALLPTGADTLHETSEFDLDSNLHTFQVTPGGNLDHIFVIKGESRYFAEEGGHSGRSYDLEIKSRAFLVSGVVETTIAEVYRSSLEKDRKSIAEFIRIYGQDGSPANGQTDSPSSEQADAPGG